VSSLALTQARVNPSIDDKTQPELHADEWSGWFSRTTGARSVIRDGAYQLYALLVPAGDLIAYEVLNSSNTLDLHVVRPDGTGDRLLSGEIIDTRSFSPDGQWIATTRDRVGVELVRIALRE
jgi:hypothetical protein